MMKLGRVLQPHSALGMLALAFSLSLGQGCARSEPRHATNATSQADAQELPFHADPGHVSPGDEVRPALAPEPQSTTGLPFRAASYPRILPSGTLLTVQLEDSLSTFRVRAGDAFAASVAAPLSIDGNTLIERGTAVIGHVESAQSQADRPGLVPGSGYFRLTLNTITIDGRQVPLQTSSLFARGTSQQQPFAASPGSASDLGSNGIQVLKGRRLTFRLIAPVTLNDPGAMANRQSPGPISE